MRIHVQLLALTLTLDVVSARSHLARVAGLQLRARGGVSCGEGQGGASTVGLGGASLGVVSVASATATDTASALNDVSVMPFLNGGGTVVGGGSSIVSVATAGTMSMGMATAGTTDVVGGSSVVGMATAMDTTTTMTKYRTTTTTTTKSKSTAMTTSAEAQESGSVLGGASSIWETSKDSKSLSSSFASATSFTSSTLGPPSPARVRSPVTFLSNVARRTVRLDCVVVSCLLCFFAYGYAYAYA